jgi:hypothetical protein
MPNRFPLARPRPIPAHTRLHAPSELIGSTSQPRAGRRPLAPMRLEPRQSAPRAKTEPTRPDLADRPRVLHVTQPFFVVVQSFYYIVSHFTITN